MDFEPDTRQGMDFEPDTRQGMNFTTEFLKENARR